MIWTRPRLRGSAALIVGALFFPKCLLFAAFMLIAGVTITTLIAFSHVMGQRLLPGTPGANRFGTNPLEVSQ